MKRQNQHWRVLSRLIGALLLFAGSFAAYWWFYKLAPVRHTADPRWLSRHSQQEYWREVQRGIRRGMWFHDDGFTVGTYGDESWAEWIMNHVRPGTDMGCFGRNLCHSATAMLLITNQDVGEDADAWLDWWEKNKSKSQEEWISDGFAQRGFKIHVPPTPEQVPILLTLLGSSETVTRDEMRFSAATNPSMAIPEHTKYNAFRCLRDSGFDPVGFALSHRTISAEVERGLLVYAKYDRCWPEAIGVGILPFGKKDDGGEGYSLPVMLTPEFQITAYALIFAPLALGTALTAWSFRRRKRNGEPRLEPSRNQE